MLRLQTASAWLRYQDRVMDSLDVVEMKAHAAWDSGRKKRAFRLFQQGAEAGLVGCMLDLGYFHDVGIGTRPDKNMAMLWYKRAHRKGEAAAASNIAILYRERGRARLCFGWHMRAVALGDGDSLVDLGKMYMSGTGVRRSVDKAKKALRSAIDSDQITEHSREEACRILKDLERGVGA